MARIQGPRSGPSGRPGRGVLLVLGWAAAVGCGHGATAAAPPEAASCDPALDPTCGLEAGVGERETKARVERADRARRRSAFTARVEAWRARLEAATASRTDDGPVLAETEEDPPAPLEADPPASLQADPPPVLAALRRVGATPEIPPSSRARPPAPRLLAAARCLIEADLELLEARVRKARADGSETAAGLALAWVDATELAGRVEAAAPPEGCETPEVAAARSVLRDLVGPAPLSDVEVEGHARGLRRLDVELREHADLPPPR